MQAIKRIISKTDFKEYNIPESFGAQAEIIILPYDPKNALYSNDTNESSFTVKDSAEAYEVLGLSGFFTTEDDKTVNWEEYFDVK